MMGRYVLEIEIRQAIEAAPREKLPDVAAVMWRAYGAGHISETQAEELSSLIEARKALPAAPPSTARRVGSRPRTGESMARRRRWAASGRLPPQVAAHFTLAEVSVLAVVTVEVVKRGDCRLFHGHIAAVAGVSRSTVRAALRHARKLGLVTVEERRASAWRNLSSVVRIVDRGWQSWNRLTHRSHGGGGGDISPSTTTTGDSKRGKPRLTQGATRGFRRAKGRSDAPDPAKRSGSRQR
jgi:hypothetical protein